MSKTLEGEITQIAAYVQARELVARAICETYSGSCEHAGQIWLKEAENVLSALTKAGLLTLNGKENK